jgi:flagellar hook assembly protein FlgD
MDISTWTKKSNSFLKAEDIKKSPQGVFVITDEGQMVKSEKFGTEQFHISGEFAGEEKTLTLSKTNGRTVEKTLGTDTQKWIGHSLSFDLYRVKTSDGKMVDAINVASVK